MASRGVGEIVVRITVEGPPPGAHAAVQWGKTGANGACELIPAIEDTTERIVFDVPVKITAGPDGAPRPAGPAVQGPTGQKFIYVNWGSYAGQGDTRMNRRAKIQLGAISAAQFEQALNGGGRLETTLAGRARDGGPACATVPLIGGWRVAD